MALRHQDDKPVTLDQVDGTVPGRAALIIINLNDTWGNEPYSLMRHDFQEDAATSDPVDACHRLWSGIRTDWPKHQATIACNPRASYLDWKTKMEALRLGSHVTPEDYLEVLSTRKQ